MKEQFLSDIDRLTNFDDNVYSPEALAWKILLDDNLELDHKLFQMVDEDEDDPIACQFELLLTVFLELIYGMMKLNFYMENDNDDNEFCPDLKKLNINDHIDFLKDKFTKLGIILTIHSYDMAGPDYDPTYLNKIIRKSYGRIVLRHSDKDKTFFIKYADNIPPEKNYWIISNATYEKLDTLNEMCATFVFHNTFYVIKFDNLFIRDN